MTFAVKKTKQRKPNLIRLEEKNDIKDKFLDSGTDQKKADDTNRLRTPTERERERETDRQTETETEAKLETTHHQH